MVVLGGSQHLAGEHLLSNGIQGGMTPIAVGLALGRQMQGINAICACFIGDGTLGEGIIYDCLSAQFAENKFALMIGEDIEYTT